MNKVQITQLKPAEIDAMGELLKTRDDFSSAVALKRKEWLEWLAFRNPYANGEGSYYIAKDGEKIIAHLGRMPTDFVVNGKTVHGYFIHDLYVHPDSKKRGMGLFISMALYQAIEKDSNSFCGLVWTSALNLAMQKQRGYHQLWAGRYVKVIYPYEKLSRFIKRDWLVNVLAPIIKTLLQAANRVAFLSCPTGIEVFKIERFDYRFDNLSDRLLSKIGVSSLKRSNYLNWKFIDRPYSKMEAFAAQQNGEISGFIVVGPNLKKPYPEGAIVDIMADPDDSATIHALVKTAINYFSKQNVYSIECCLTDKRFIRVFRRYLFVRAFEQEPVMLANLAQFEEADYLKNIDNWHLTYGDSDEFMLRP